MALPRALKPQSLLWRTFWLVALLMLLSMAAWYLSFNANVHEPRARQFAQTLTSIINLTRSALISTRGEAREELLRDLSDREGLRLLPAYPGDRIEPLPEGRGLSLVEDILIRSEGAGTHITLKLNGEPGLFVRFHVADRDLDYYWLALPRERAEHALPVEWLNWAITVAVLALIGAWLIAWSLRRTLNSLTAAAVAIGAGKKPQPVIESGPAEIADLARAFNRMMEDLDRLDEDRALLLAGVSHDLRTPLTRLRMGVEMSDMDETLREESVTNIEEMDRTIGQFLDFARGDKEENKRDIDIVDLLSQLAAQYQRRGKALHIVAAQPVRLPAHVETLRRAIANLIENALRYGGAAAPVELAANSERVGNARFVVIEVRDRGPGIPATEIERLKRPFTRRDTARSSPGTGLGLAIVERIARAHGGGLELLARAGGGLIARIRLAAG